MTQHPLVGLAAACSVSLIAHGIAYASLALAPKPTAEPPPSRVAFRVHETEAPKPAPRKRAEPDPPARERHAVAARPTASLPVSTPVPVTPPAAAPVDLRGVTLTNDTGRAAWASAVGNGASLDAPVGPVGAKSAPSSPAPLRAAATPVPLGVPVVDLADLSARPVPPELGASLRAYYPGAARTRGVGGSATVRARIEPDGHVRRVELVSETFEGFGEACRRTLQASSWSPPRDRDGRAVATYVRYTCRFVVGP
jgi:TonB family protein